MTPISDARRRCEADNKKGAPCGSAPLKGFEYCFLHSPDHKQEAAEARRLGGIHRRREAIISEAHDLAPTDSVDGIRRLLDIVVVDTLAHENSIARSRTLIYAATVAMRLLETGELESRITQLELIIVGRGHSRGR